MDIKRIEGLKIVTDCSMPADELAHIEKEKKEAYNKAIDDVLKIVRLENVSNSNYCICAEKDVLKLPHSNTPYCSECGKNIKQA